MTLENIKDEIMKSYNKPVFKKLEDFKEKEIKETKKSKGRTILIIAIIATLIFSISVGAFVYYSINGDINLVTCEVPIIPECPAVPSCPPAPACPSLPSIPACPTINPNINVEITNST